MTDKEFQKHIEKLMRQHEEDKHLSTLQIIKKRSKKRSPKPKRNT
tara:strand:+ start:700 stop:834 length:135 start_codon:yes stop_codon:yes gene_type:complete